MKSLHGGQEVQPGRRRALPPPPPPPRNAHFQLLQRSTLRQAHRCDASIWACGRVGTQETRGRATAHQLVSSMPLGPLFRPPSATHTIAPGPHVRAPAPTGTCTRSNCIRSKADTAAAACLSSIPVRAGASAAWYAFSTSASGTRPNSRESRTMRRNSSSDTGAGRSAPSAWLYCCSSCTRPRLERAIARRAGARAAAGGGSAPAAAGPAGRAPRSAAPRLPSVPSACAAGASPARSTARTPAP